MERKQNQEVFVLGKGTLPQGRSKERGPASVEAGGVQRRSLAH